MHTVSELYEIDSQLAAVREPGTRRNLLDPGDPNPLKVEMQPNSPALVTLEIENGPEGLIELTISADEPWVSPESGTFCLLGSESRPFKVTIKPEGEEDIANLLFCWDPS